MLATETNARAKAATSTSDALRLASARHTYDRAYTYARRTGATKPDAHAAGLAAQAAHHAGTTSPVPLASDRTPRTVEQVVTKAEQAQGVVAEAEAITRDAAPTVTAVPTCTHTGCLNAIGDHDTCECQCGGIGHGAAYQVRATAARAKAQARFDAAGGAMEYLRRMGGLTPADEPW